MEWINRGKYALSDPPGYCINRSGDARVVYMAIRLGKPFKPRWNDPPGAEPHGWEGSQILHVERNLDPTNKTELAAAYQRCKEACT